MVLIDFKKKKNISLLSEKLLSMAVMKSYSSRLFYLGFYTQGRNGSFQALEFYKSFFVLISDLEIFDLNFIRKRDLTFFSN